MSVQNGPQGSLPFSVQDPTQSLSLSAKQKSLFTKTILPIGINLYNYERKDPQAPLNSLKIVRCAIPSLPMPNPTTLYSPDKFILLENEAFTHANNLLNNSKSSETAIQARLTGLNPLPDPNNVILLDIYGTVIDNNSNQLKIREDRNKKGFPETHTVCLWKKCDNLYKIIDPSSSEFSKRIEKCVEFHFFAIGSSPLNYKILEHIAEKFYEVPQNTQFTDKSITPIKLRDCIDIALKIGILLKQGELFLKSPCEIENSINLLSNQSAVNPILPETFTGIHIKALQSTRKEKRLEAMHSLVCIPSAFTQFFSYLGWTEFNKMGNDKQNDILKVLRIFNKELSSLGFTAKFSSEKNDPQTQKDAKEKKHIQEQFDRLEILAQQYHQFNTLNDQLKTGRFSIKLILPNTKK